MDLRIPVSSNRQFTYRVRVANVKMPWLLVFTRHVEIAIIEAWKPRSITLLGGRTLFAMMGAPDFEKNSPCNVEDNLCTGLIVIEAWFRGY